MAESTASKPRRVRVRFIATARPPQQEEDDLLVSAINPEPSWMLQVTEVGAAAPLGAFELWHPMDLAWSETIKLLSIERETAGLPSSAYLERVREQVQLLMPDLPDTIFGRLTAQQLLLIGQKAWQRPQETSQEASSREADAANPLDGGRGSASSSRSPVGSMDGAIAS